MEMTRNQQQVQDITAEREKGGERKRRERGGGKKQIVFPIQIQIIFKIKIKKPNPPGPKKVHSDVGIQNETPILHSLS